MSRSVLSQKVFCIDDHKISFAAGLKRGIPVVVFGIATLSDVPPLLTLEKEHPSTHSACQYVQTVTEIAAGKLLDYYRREHLPIVALVDAAFTGRVRTVYSSRHKSTGS